MAIQSPFPGMDPYLEQHWRDVHQSIVIYARDQLQDHLPASLRARVEERVFVEADDGDRGRSIYPDIRVTERPGDRGGVALATPETDLGEHVEIQVDDEPVTESFIEIVEAGSGHRVVSVIEVVSMANKAPGPGRDLYQRKQQELRDGGVSLVEIDLLRGGDWALAIPRYHIPAPHRDSPYKVCIRRGWQPTRYRVYPIGLRQRLPKVDIPLRESDPAAVLDLQALIEQAYRNGRYDDLDYRRPPEPPLGPEDATWAEELLRGKGVR